MVLYIVIMSMKSVLVEEIGLISLSRGEVRELEKVAKGFIASLKAEGLKAFVGGSLAKGTLVRKDRQDVDVFVVFDYGEDVVRLEKVLKKVDLPGKLRKVHGSRDYFQIDSPLDSLWHRMGQGVLLEVIPVVKNSDPELAENVTDVSLRHVKYVVGAIKKDPKLADEIKLAKAFCYANRVYGAESYVKGFSGYALEILVIHFGSFLKFLKKMQAGSGQQAAGDRKIVVDPLKYFRGEREVLSEINASKLGGPVVLVDPTFKYRNVTAGLGDESFERFLKVSKEFIGRPSLDYFEMKDIDVKALRALAGSGQRAAGSIFRRGRRGCLMKFLGRL